MNQTSTITGGVVTFEGTYDGINWETLPDSDILDPVAYTPIAANPYTFQPDTNYTILLNVGAFQQIRARLSTVISGTGNVTIYWTLLGKTVESTATGNTNQTIGTAGYERLTDGANTSVLFPAGYIYTSDISRQLFVDNFSTLDTVNRWTSASGGGGIAPTVTIPDGVSLGTGTTANGYSYLVSKPSFQDNEPGWLRHAWLIQTEYPVIANTYRFWGTGIPATAPIAEAPITDGAGFELYTDGKLYAVVYSNGARIVVQDLSSSGNGKQPTDGLIHDYAIYYRTAVIYWTVDFAAEVAATNNFTQLPGVGQLPTLMLAIAGSSPTPSSSGFITSKVMDVSDNAKHHTTIADSTYKWRQATVTAASTAAVPTDSALVVAISPNNSVTVQDSADMNGTIPGTAPEKTMIVGGIYNSSLPTPESGQTLPLQTDANGNLLVNTLIPGTVGRFTGTLQPAQLFDDCFDGVSLNAAQWTTQTSGSGASVSVVLSDLVITVNTTASSGAAAISVATLQNKLSLLGISFQDLSLDTTLTGGYRFWGLGTLPGTWAAATPVQDGVGFAINPAGHLLCVIYQGGAAVYSTTISPSTFAYNNGAFHNYYILYQQNQVYWYADNFSVPLASASGYGTNNESMNLLAFVINGTSSIGYIPAFYCDIISAGDTGNQNVYLSDGIYPWRKATVTAASTAAVPTDSALVVAVSPNNPVAVTGTFYQSTQPVSLTSTTITGTVAVTQSTSSWVVSGTVTANAGTGTFTVDASGHTVPVSGVFWQATQPVSGTVTANAGTNLNTSALALETGGNLATLAGTVSSSKVTVTGTVTANAGTGNFTVVQGTGTNLHAVIDSGSTTAVTQATAANLKATVTPAAASVFSVQDSQAAIQSVNFTSATAADTANTVALSTPQAANVAVSLYYTGTVTGGQLFFEVSNDNSNWYTITMAPIDGSSNPTDNYVLSSAAGNIAWQMFVGAFTYFRARMHVQVVGSGTAAVGIISSVIAAEPAVALCGGVAAVTQSGTWTNTVTQATGTNLHAVLDTGSTTAVTQATGSNLHVVVDTAPTTAVTGTFWQATQPVSLASTAITGTVAVQTTAASYVPATINSTGQVSFTSTATLIIAINTSRQGIVITNPGTTISIYIGTSGVTAATGLPLAPGQAITLPTTAALYAIVASTAQTVGWLEIQ